MPYKDPAKQREYQRAWMQQRRAEFLFGKACAQCDSREGLQVDHIDASKKIDHRIWSWSEQRRAEELKKCQVLCQPCHQRKTNLAEIGQEVGAHGAPMYRRGCRCNDCRAGHAALWRATKARRKLHQ